MESQKAEEEKDERTEPVAGPLSIASVTFKITFLCLLCSAED